MEVSVVWSSPQPEMTIAVAMRRCYSTKTIEEIEGELMQKGPEYWKYLLTKCLQDKSLDVLEHFTLTLMVEGMDEASGEKLVLGFPYLRLSWLGKESWLVSLNARTLLELWRESRTQPFAEAIVSELDAKGVCPIFSQLAFGEKTDAR